MYQNLVDGENERLNPRLGQVDAYLLLKMKVQLAVERLLKDETDEMPGTLMPVHFFTF